MAGAGGGVAGSGRITFSARRKTGRSESVSELELELELELESALRSVGPLEGLSGYRLELSTELPPNSMRAISVTSTVRTLTPSSTRTVRAVPPRYVPLITRPLFNVMVSANPRVAQAKAIPA
jgi:hypothetical protein